MVSHFSIDHVVLLGDYHFVGFLLLEAMNLQSSQTMENRISEVLCSSRQQYREYIINLCGVKDSRMSNTKCAILSRFFYTISIPLIQNFFIF